MGYGTRGGAMSSEWLAGLPQLQSRARRSRVSLTSQSQEAERCCEEVCDEECVREERCISVSQCGVSVCVCVCVCLMCSVAQTDVLCSCAVRRCSELLLAFTIFWSPEEGHGQV